MKVAKTQGTTKTPRKTPKAPTRTKKGQEFSDNDLASRVGNHPQLAAWWGRITNELHWVQDELACGTGPFTNLDRDLARHLVWVLDQAWADLTSEAPFGPPAEFAQVQTLAPTREPARAMTVEQLKAAVRAYANENLPGWACSGISFRVGEIGAGVTESLVVLPNATATGEQQ